MKILFVSTSPLEYGASSNMRNVALLKGLIENGNSVSTLTPEYQKDSALYDESQCNLKFDREYRVSLGTLHSSFTAKRGTGIKNFMRKKIYNFIKKFKIYDFRNDIAKKKTIIKEKFDVIISSSDPKSSHLMALTLIKNNPNICKKWIQYWGDPFADDINDNRKIMRFFIKREEEKLIRACDKVVYVSPFTLKKQKKIFSRYSSKMYFLPIPYKEKKIYEKQNNDKLTIGYFGNYYVKNRDILPLYKFANDNKEIKLIVCGGTDLLLNSEDNIVVKERLSVEEINKFEEKCDVLVCVCNKFGTQIPGKIYHYSATNKPILIILDGEYANDMKEYFESFNRFIICNNDVESIKNAFETINLKEEYNPLDSLSAKSIAKNFLIGVK